ncbi:hypothetical protein PUNSTDRAFT_76910 [Punctularia strigosozonata HHB-11173 SS5]|uniref:Reverse transcriptase zinc-binding domain-containing protein n=1 Tax=Punctularia strigosozonata (strain HHB-11173) TaxID=741275 RepID=R7S1N3_PUNST|nr:uncharacterized protein PUNSTDRAFT_76910 [Punctularia strigosozonata HHB-11173 SS5]EIN04138.1 hypothetical protein PUNSTDRAFT_76910 [Punctularia strigosozonata HHB-11173 SS5]
MRTGHIALAKHLYRIKKVNSPVCPGCRTHGETVSHYLMHCRKYDTERGALRRDLGIRGSNIKFLLTDSKAFPALFRYIAATGRFAKSHGDLQFTSTEWKEQNEDE